MEELKTLKDMKEKVYTGDIIEGCEEWYYKIDYRNLKAEAVKDYKRLLKVYEKGDTLFKEHGKIAEGFEVDLYDYEQNDICGILKYIKWKFNLTEDDLL